MATSRLITACSILLAACGAGDNRIDPSSLALRDVLGISPRTAASWDSSQRASAHRVIEDSLGQSEAPPIHASFGPAPAVDQRVARALASVDAGRASHGAGALGLVHVAIGGGAVVVTPRVATIEPDRESAVEIRLAGWSADPVLAELAARGQSVLPTLAAAAGHTSGPVIVTPVPRLAMAAGYLPATRSDPARLVVNPVVLAALEPASPTVATSPPRTRTITANADGNPYSFYGSVAECAAVQRARCETCLPQGTCSAVTNAPDGNTECTTLAATGGRGYFLLCADLALAIDSVSSCTLTSAPSCTFDPNAGQSLSTLENNAEFVDNLACGNALDACLADIYGASAGGFPGPGSGSGSSTTPPRDTSVDCDASDMSCDDSSCDDSSGSSCDDSSGSSGDSGCGDSCSGDSEDSCGADNSSGCDGGGGDSCSGDSGGDCSGGGGDCGGGGEDCNAAGRHGRHGRGGVTPSMAWALLPLVFGTIMKRRARRKRPDDREPSS